MSIDTRPAMSSQMPRAGAKRDNGRLMRWFSSAVTALTDAIAILVVAVVALTLGIT